VQHLVQTRLARELPLFFTQILEIGDDGMRDRGNQHPQLGERGYGARVVAQARALGARRLKERQHLGLEERADGLDILLRQPVLNPTAAARAHGRGTSGEQPVIRGDFHRFRPAAAAPGELGDESLGLNAELVADAVNLVVDGFHRNAFQDDGRQIVLENGTEDAAQDGNDQQPEKNRGQQAAEMESAVEEDEREGEQAEPEVAAHPGLGSSQSHDGDFFARAEQPGVNHEAEAGEAEDQADG
jgi:hypothetical protein